MTGTPFSSHDAFAHGALLDVLHRIRNVHNTFHEHARRDDVVGIDLAWLDQILDLGNGDLPGRGHHRIEIARGLAINEIALGISLPGMNDRKVGDQAALHHVALAIDLALLLPCGDQGPGAGRGEEGRDAAPASADTLGQRALRIELDLELAGEILLREGLVLPNIGRDHLLDLPGVQQEAQSDAVDPGIVGDDRQVFHTGLANRLDQALRDAAQPQPPAHNQHAVLEQAGERRPGVGIDLFHAPPAWIEVAAESDGVVQEGIGRRPAGIFYRAAAKAAIARCGGSCPVGSAGACLGLDPDQFGSMPAARIMAPNFWWSLASRSRYSSLLRKSRFWPIAAIRLWTSGISVISRMAWLSRATTSGGVPAGAAMPSQASRSKPGTGFSASVATWGRIATRCGVVTPSVFTLPCSTNCITPTGVDHISGT